MKELRYIKKYLEENRLTQKELAKEAGVSASSVCRLLKYKKVSKETFDKINKAIKSDIMQIKIMASGHSKNMIKLDMVVYPAIFLILILILYWIL